MAGRLEDGVGLEPAAVVPMDATHGGREGGIGKRGAGGRAAAPGTVQRAAVAGALRTAQPERR